MMDITLKSDRDGTVHNMCMGYVTKGRMRRYVIIDMFTRMKYLCDDIKTSFDAGSIFTDTDAVIWRFAEKVLGWRRGGWSCGMAGKLGRLCDADGLAKLWGRRGYHMSEVII